MKITDGTRTVDIRMATWNGTGYSPDWSMDFFNAGSLPYDNETETFAVDDVDYCIDQALDWKFSRGDYACDEPNENNEVIIEDVPNTKPRMTVREFALHMIKHSYVVPEQFDLARSAEIISMLVHDAPVPENMTAEDFMAAWNEIVRNYPPEDIWS